MPFEFERLKIEEVILVKPKVFGDSRGFFMENMVRNNKTSVIKLFQATMSFEK